MEARIKTVYDLQDNDDHEWEFGHKHPKKNERTSDGKIIPICTKDYDDWSARGKPRTWVHDRTIVVDNNHYNVFFDTAYNTVMIVHGELSRLAIPRVNMEAVSKYSDTAEFNDIKVFGPGYGYGDCGKCAVMKVIK